MLDTKVKGREVGISSHAITSVEASNTGKCWTLIIELTWKSQSALTTLTLIYTILFVNILFKEDT
jgi:hypothetical protein